MRAVVDSPAHPAVLAALLEGLVQAHCAMVAAGVVDVPPLYRSGVRYRREPRGQERWQLPWQTFEAGHGDCEDLAVWRAAELRLAGYGARPVVYRTGPRTLHVVVWRDDRGDIEDPSRLLGM